MINHFLLFCSLFVSFSLGVYAQSELTLKNNMIFTDVTVSHNGTSHKVQTLIDTGASVCMIDSTYAVDSCNIILPKSRLVNQYFVLNSDMREQRKVDIFRIIC